MENMLGERGNKLDEDAEGLLREGENISCISSKPQVNEILNMDAVFQ